MIQIATLLDDVTAQADEMSLTTNRVYKADEPHDCDVCGVATPDVDLWAEEPETGEQIWLCLSCGC